MLFFFFNDTATTEIYTLSLHDALPIFYTGILDHLPQYATIKAIGYDDAYLIRLVVDEIGVDRKSTRLNSSHANISYAVFCLKKKKKENFIMPQLQQQCRAQLCTSL